MDELHKFIFEGLPVRGMLVRLDSGWRELLERRTSRDDGGHAFAAPVRALLGEMAAAGCLMQGSLKFNGAAVTPTFTKDGTTATIAYKPATMFASKTTNTATLTYKDPGGNDATLEWTFVVAEYRGPIKDAVKPTRVARRKS